MFLKSCNALLGALGWIETGEVIFSFLQTSIRNTLSFISRYGKLSNDRAISFSSGVNSILTFGTCEGLGSIIFFILEFLKFLLHLVNQPFFAIYFYILSNL